MTTTTTQFKAHAQPTREQIAKRAYEIYLAEGRPTGRSLHHWHLAEKELQLPGDLPVMTPPKPHAKPTSSSVAATTH